VSKAILVPMLLLYRSPRLWEQHALFVSSEPGVTMEVIEALTGADLGVGDRKDIARRLSILLAHLLKWEFGPEGRTERCQAAIQAQRVRIAMTIIRRPSLGRYPSRILRERYRTARSIAMADTGLGKSAFPEDCPYSAVQALDSGYLPAAA
jgi:hypothetical protein